MRAEGGPVDLVLEGGGVKGIGLVGALSMLEERGWTPSAVAGTSAGAITAALLAAGYSAGELRDILVDLDFHAFTDRGPEDRLPLVGEALSVLTDRGVFEGAYLEGWIADLLAERGVRSFADLVEEAEAGDQRRRYRLRVIASDVTGRRLLALPQDAHHLGMEPDELTVARAVRMSMSIPLFFEPVKVAHGTTGVEHLIVDGGLLSNFPVWLFDCQGRPPRWPTFGLLLVEDDPRVSLAERLGLVDGTPRREGVVGYLKALAQTAMEAHDRLYVEQRDFVRTIPIPTLGVRTTEFDLSRDRALELYESGRRSAERFLDGWDSAAYVERYRQAAVEPRRDSVRLRP